MKKLAKIKSAILKNKGATFNNNGRTATLKTGFIVSEQAHGLILSIAEFNGLTLARFNALLHKARRLGAFLGFWIFENKVYIDFNKHISDKAQAIAYGKEQKQLAIWSCADMCEIPIKSE